MFSRTLPLHCVVITVLAVAGHTQVPSTFHPPLAVLRSAHAEGAVSESHTLQALWYAAAELNVPPEKVPRILVIHGGEDVTVAGAWTSHARQKSSGAVLIEPTKDGGKVYYLWILGKPSDEILAQGMVQILRTDLGVSGSDLAMTTKRVVSHLGSVIGADDLQKGMFVRR